MADSVPATDPQNPLASSAPPIPNGAPATMDVEMTDSAPPPVEIHPAPDPAPQPHPLSESTNAPPLAPAQTPAAQPFFNPAISTPTHLSFPPTAAPAPAPTTSATTPSRNSPHPPTVAPSAPTHPNPHGSPTRVYLNQNVTPYLLEGMKHLVTSEPDKPLKWLSEYLAMRSQEIEGP